MITYLKGDATVPQKNSGVRVIAHICNDAGGWGRGFVVALHNRWKRPRERFKAWYAVDNNLPLGEIQIVSVETDNILNRTFVANMIAQHNFKTKENPVPLDYKALAECLTKLDNWTGHYIKTINKMAMPHKLDPKEFTIHMPRIGCGLAGGDWNEVEKILKDTINFDIFVYDLEKK